MSIEEQGILTEFERHQTMMERVGTTSGRRYHFDIMVKMWNENPIIQTVWDFYCEIRLLIHRFVKKIANAVRDVAVTVRPNTYINWNGIQPMKAGIQQVYLIEMLDADHQLIYSKVGTTTRETQKRMQEHLRYYKEEGIKFINVLRLYDCGVLDAEGLESDFRAKYIREFPGTFRKNDRFINVKFDLDKADEIVKKYLEN